MKIKYYFLIMLSFLMLSSCASPYIGKEVKYDQVCQKKFGECTGRVGKYLVSYSIHKDDDGYEVKGEATFLETKTSMYQIYTVAMFTLYLIKDLVVVEAIPVAGGSGRLDSKITFQKKFKSKEFEHSSIGYSMRVEGW